ncbi:heat shock protein transcriptional repressor HspR [Microbacterium mangrovi]|uniref:heat shock protein transcriptional repressor HspR n=1 Tax=Microbacterium mangrovi TaxID=1348253 RepID=UPI00068E966B|nr:MerR family transcriptional regulator [Microbacterium mangrovi]
MIDGDELDQEAPILAIAAAAELAGMHPQTLRQYDRLGLVVPARTQGGSRRYSLRHVHQLREVARMSADGMSLPAIARIIELEDRVRELHVRVQTLEMQMRVEVENRPGSRVFAAESSGSVISLRRGTRLRRTREVVLWQPRALPGGDATEASATPPETSQTPSSDAS